MSARFTLHIRQRQARNAAFPSPGINRFALVAGARTITLPWLPALAAEPSTFRSQLQHDRESELTTRDATSEGSACTSIQIGQQRVARSIDMAVRGPA
jgi:hypothetical protein